MQNINTEQFQQIITLVYILIGLLGTLAFVGVGGLIVFARSNKEVLRMAFQSASPETQLMIRSLVKQINEAADLAAEVTTPGALIAPETGSTVTVTPPADSAAAEVKRQTSTLKAAMDASSSGPALPPITYDPTTGQIVSPQTEPTPEPVAPEPGQQG